MVTEARQDIRYDNFEYWLNIIGFLGKNSPLIIVTSKCDEPNTGFAIKSYRLEYPNIVHHQKVSCLPDYKHTIRTLKAEIKRLVKNKKMFPDIGTELPQNWIEIRKKIEELRESGKKYISKTQYLNICATNGLDDETAIFLSDFFHDLGIFLFFREEFELSETIFLDFNWITEAVYKILDDHEVIDAKGVFSKSDLNRIWKDNQHMLKKLELLALMVNEKFKLCFSLGEKKYLVPQLLPKDEIAHNWNYNNNIIFIYEYAFMPAGIFEKFIVLRHRDIYEDSYWKYGTILKYEETKAFVIEESVKGPKRIIIRLRGKNKKGFLEIIRKSFNEIHSAFNGLEVAEKIL